MLWMWTMQLDDQALMDETKAGLQETTDLLRKFCEYSGLNINVDKTKSMALAVDRSCSQPSNPSRKQVLC